MEQYIRPNWSHFVAYIWEQLCRDFLAPAGMDGRLPFIPEEVGKWWSGTSEIDVVGVDRYSKRAILGEARWRDRPIGKKTLDELLNKSRPWLQKNRGWRITYTLFSRSGFSNEVEKIAAAQSGEIVLFEPEDLIRVTE